MKEIVVEIPWNEGKANVKLVKLTFGQRNECLRKATNINPLTQSATLDPYTFSELRLVASIKEAPFPVGDVKVIRDLEPEVGDLLVTTLEKLNEVGAAIEKKS
jgi:hypothetical protein